MIKYNIVIVGAGPAGSYLANKLKNQGIKTLLLEKEVFPRYKTCAGGLSKKTYDILFSENKNVEKIIEKKIRKGLFVRNKKFTFRESRKELIYMIYRSELDQFLVNMAIDNDMIYLQENISIKKINLMNNTITYIEKNNKHNVKYDVLVGAWGSNIHLNKLIDLSPFERFAISSSWEGPVGSRFNKYFDEYAVCQILQEYPSIVGYIFPKTEMITAGLFTSLYPVPSVLKNMWKEFMDFWKLDIDIKPRYALIPILDFRKAIAKKNILLVGDAAGLADPFTGEGIYYAFISSEIASKHIINFFKNKNYNLSLEYDKEIKANLLDIQKWAKIYEFLFQHFPNFSFWFGSEFFLGNEILNFFLTGEIKYNEVPKIIKYSVKRIFGKKIDIF